MENKVTISIICAAYNAEKYIKQTIESILAQTINDWELIIVDDCSTDNTLTIVEQYVERYTNIVLVKNKVTMVLQLPKDGILLFVIVMIFGFLKS